MNFLEGNECTTFRTITSVLVEADYLDDKGNIETAELIRLHNDIRCGRSVDLNRVAKLTDILGVRDTKVVTSKLLRNRGTRGMAILSHPFGTYYTRFTIPYIALNMEEVRLAWDNNPIEDVGITEIPTFPDKTLFQSNRLVRTRDVLLHFHDRGLSTCMELLRGLGLSCTTLTLANVEVSPALLETLRRALKFPNLLNLRTA